VAGALNAAGDVVLVAGLGMGVEGAAWATSASLAVQAAVLLRGLRRAAAERLPGVDVRPRAPSALSDLAPLLATSVPFLVNRAIIVGKVFVWTFTGSSFGVLTLAAHLVAMTLWKTLILVGEPLSSAAQAMLPAMLSSPDGGERARVVPTVRVLVALSAVLGAALGAASLAAMALAPGAFTRDPAVLATAASLAPQICLSTAVFPALLALEGTLFASGRAGTMCAVGAWNLGFLAAGCAWVRACGLPVGVAWWVFASMQVMQTAVTGVMVRAMSKGWAREPAAAAAA